MAETKQSNGRTSIEYMARDYDSLLRSMQELIPQKLPEWDKFASEADFGNVLLQLFAHMGDILSYYQDRVANESFLSTAVTRRAVIDHLRLIGYKLATAVPAAASLRLEVQENEMSVVTLRKGDAFATKSQKNSPSIRFEYSQETPLVIDFGGILTHYEDPVTRKKKKIFVGIPVEEGRLIKDEVLGISNGKPNQHFILARSGLILRPSGFAQEISRDVKLITELGGVVDPWILRESLAFSREQQKDYVIEVDQDDQATIIFGDGRLGAIPATGATIKMTYRLGGGIFGNVAANTIQTIVNAPQLALIGAKINNENPATGGADRESMEHAVLHAPAVFRSFKRAVTRQDYEALALQFKGVGKVRAESAGWNVVNLFVAPEGGGDISDVLRHNLLAYFEDKRPITTTIEVEGVDYVKIFVTAKIGIKSYYIPEEVVEQVQKAAGNLLAFDNVDFGQILYLSKFYEVIEGIDGVAYVNITEFALTPDQLEKTGKLVLEPGKIPRIPDDPEDSLAYASGIRVIVLEERQ